MAASPTAVPSPKTDGGNALAALLAAAAASMHRQQQQQQQQQRQHHQQPQPQKHHQQQQTHANVNSKVHNQTLTNNNASERNICNSKEIDGTELRNLESWHDEDEEPIDDSCYQELVDPNNSNGWSADDMFKYNERMHKITTSYNEKTLSDNYTTPLPKINSKSTIRLATQLAKEIEERVIAEGRKTPESSDDDELFEAERMRRVKLKQQRQLNQLKNLNQHQSQHRFSNNHGSLMNNLVSMSKTTKSSSQYSNSTATPVTASLSSSPTLNDTIIKPVTSSSRNILRTCLT